MFRFYATLNVGYKATQNARYEQMSKQERLIEEKKQEIQKKLEEKKRKETEEALKKLNPEAAAVVDRRGSGASNSRSKWASKRSADVLEDEPPTTTTSVRPANVFSNDGSFLDQFKKMTGMKGRSKHFKKECESPNNTSSSTVSDNTKVDEQSEFTSTESYSERRGTKMRDKRHCDEKTLDRPRSGRWDKSPVQQNIPESMPSVPVPSHQPPIPASPYRPNNGVLHQEPPHTISTHPPVLQSNSMYPPLRSYMQDHGAMSNAYPLPLVPPPMQASLIPAPAPINPGTIPAPLPIVPCSIPQPSPIQPSAIPPPSPIIPHSIPPPLPISPNMIPQPSPLVLHNIPPPRSNSVSTCLKAPSAVSHSRSPSPPPPVPGSIYIPLPHLSSSDSNNESDLPALTPHHTIKYPSKGSRLSDSSTQSTVASAVSYSVPAERIFTEDVSPKRDGDDVTDERVVKREVTHLEVKREDRYTSKIDETHSISQDLIVEGVKLENEDESSQSYSSDGNQQANSNFEDNKKNIQKTEYDSIDGVPLIGFSSSGFETEIKKEFQQQPDDSSQDGESASAARRKKRRSRWAPEEQVIAAPPPTVGPIGVVAPTVLGSTPVPLPTINVPGMKGPLISQLTRTDPALLQYAIKNFGSTQLSEEDWKKAEDHFKINLLYQDMLKKRRELEKLEAAGKFKYEYDSDEETEGGTWEHKLREKEMVATQLWADELTEAAKGKHHIGDFLPPEELSRFMEKYEAMKHGRPPDLSDYKEYKLKEDNIGFQMLQKLGWTEGQGLGSDGSGIVDPVNKATVRADNQGLGIERPDDVNVGDDEYDAYRKRMMLAYRFRPNPLNNPRRPYY